MKHNHQNNYGEYLEYVRKKKGVTQQAVADAVGLRRQTISTIENMHVDTAAMNLFLWCHAIGLNMGDVHAFINWRVDNDTPLDSVDEVESE